LWQFLLFDRLSTELVLLRQGLLPPTEIQTDKREGDIADVLRNITPATTRRFNHILSKGKDCILPAIIHIDRGIRYFNQIGKKMGRSLLLQESTEVA
jgi:hypothetical protein